MLLSIHQNMRPYIQKQKIFQALNFVFDIFLKRVPGINFTELPFCRIPMARIPSEDPRRFF
jgi:hypothetical protein